MKKINIEQYITREEYLSHQKTLVELAETIGCHWITLWKKAQELGWGNRGQQPRRYKLQEDIFTECNTPETAYWLGFIMADGGIVDNGKRHCLRMRLSSKDMSHLKALQLFLKTDSPIREINALSFGKKQSAIDLTIYSKRLVQDLQRYGIIARKTGLEVIKNIPYFLRRDFIRGYIDGDGWICSKSNVCLGVASASLKLLKQIVIWFFCNHLIPRIKNNIPYRNGCYSVTFNGAAAKEIHRYLYNGAIISLQRKAHKFND